MNSPQRYKVPFQKSTNINQSLYKSPKRKSPERLTREEFVDSKRAKFSPSPTLNRINNRNKVIPAQNFISLNRMTPPSDRMCIAPNRVVKPHGLNRAPQTSRLSLLPNQSPQASRMSLAPTRTLQTPRLSLMPNKVQRPSRLSLAPSPVQKPSLAPNHVQKPSRISLKPSQASPTKNFTSPHRTTPARRLSMKSNISPVSAMHRSRMSITPNRTTPSHHLSNNNNAPATHHTVTPKKNMTPKSTIGVFSRTRLIQNPIITKPNTKETLYTTASSFSTPKPFQKIKVCIRKRPLSKQELEKQEKDIAYLCESRTIEIHASKKKVDLTNYVTHHAFTFDEVFDSTTSNKTIYKKTTQPLVEYMFQGGKSTCFAYGQTGSGKTYTMLDPQHGLFVQATTDIFDFLKKAEYDHLQACVGYYEIYQGQLYDLLNNRHVLIPREDSNGSVQISGLKEYKIHSPKEMMTLLDHGNRGRRTCKTKSNQTSSRSHAVLQILLKTPKMTIAGKLNFIDLAGSERGTDRGIHSDMKIRLEGAEINRSLLALKECIRALDKDKSYAPFRGSKLTMVLKDSFVGNSRTCMIATISPNQSNSDHTLNTLRYADRVKELRGESDPRLSKEEPVKEQETGLNKSHITEFIHWHQVEVKGNEMQLKEAQFMMNLFEKEMETIKDTKLVYEKYNNYKKNVQHLLDRKLCLIENLKNRIKKELLDEHEM